MSSLSRTKRSVNSLPEDLILEVFLRLPRKSLARAKCVSKGLLILINRQKFKKRYDTFHNSVSDFAVIYLECSRLLLSMSFRLPDNLDASNERSFNFLFDDSYSFFVGCCKGIVCLMTPPNISSSMTELTAGKYLLFNPFNDTFKEVKGYNITPLKFRFTVGFGYDYATDDYKIIRFEPGHVTCVYVYSLRRDSWRQVIVKFTPGSAEAYKGICVDGAIHWLWTEDPNVFGSYIAAFDLETESMRSVPLPKVKPGLYWILKNLGGRLCVCVKSPIDGSTAVWVMEEYGVKTSWTALFNIENGIEPFGYFPTWDDARLLCNGLGSEWLWLNTQDGSKKIIQVQKFPRRGYVFRFEIESWICERSPLRLGCAD